MSLQPVTSIFDRDDFAKRITKIRNDANLTRDEVVSLSNNGFARSSLQAWEVGDREPKIDNIFDLAKIYNISPQYLIFGDKTDCQAPQPILEVTNDEYAYIPAYDIEASAGHGSCVGDNEVATKHLAFRKQWIAKRGLNAKMLVALFTKGDSMEPTIADGGAIVVRKDRTQIIDSRVYVISINGDLFVKRVQRLPNGLKLISDNKFYDPLIITKEDIQDSDVKICGQVIHASYDLPD